MANVSFNDSKSQKLVAANLSLSLPSITESSAWNLSGAIFRHPWIWAHATFFYCPIHSYSSQTTGGKKSGIQSEES